MNSPDKRLSKYEKGYGILELTIDKSEKQENSTISTTCHFQIFSAYRPCRLSQNSNSNPLEIKNA